MSEEQNKLPRYGGLIKKNPKLGALILAVEDIALGCFIILR